MSLPVNELFKTLLEAETKSPQIILEVEGWPPISSIPAKKYANYGDDIVFGQSGLFFNGLILDSSILPYIDLNKTTNQITQQLQADKGGSQSVTSFDVGIIDKDQIITELITPNKTIVDVLGVKARLYLSLEGAGHPKDSILFFSGIVAGASSGAGYVNINLASPEKLKNLEIFPKVSTELAAGITNVATTINVASTDDFVLPADSGTLRTYLLLNDEIIEYTGKTSTSFTGCVRGQFGTIAVAHNLNDNIESAYRLTGNLRDLSLKLMLSGINEPYLKDEPILSFVQYGSITQANSIFVSRYNFDQYYGTVTGDGITITDSATPSNNVTGLVTAIETTDLGSYITINQPLTLEGSGAKFSISSKYSVLPKFCGLEMTPDQVDVAEFENIYLQNSTQFFDLDFFIKDSVKGAEFINTEILFVNFCYALPRKTKTSIGLTKPPLAAYETKVLDETTVISASQLKINRNISSNFYNAIVIKYDKDQVEDKFKRGKITQSADSTNRIKVANKPLTIEAAGVRFETNFVGKFATISRRALERYQFAAESIDVQVPYGVGFDIEIGDTVVLKGLQISDTKDASGSRGLKPRIFEVTNLSKNTKGTPIKLSLLDTAYSLNGRYGVISPSSKIGLGSTTTVLKLKKSYGTNLTTRSENYKWRNLVGARLRIRSVDYSFSEERILLSLNPVDDSSIILDSALSLAPLENYVVDIVNYPNNADPEDQALSKSLYVFFNNTLEVVSGISQTQFTVSMGALADIAVGYIIYTHDKNYNNKSAERNVIDITGTTITLDGNLGYVPAAGDKIELLGYADGGRPYRII
jgi:hypothetical protein